VPVTVATSWQVRAPITKFTMNHAGRFCFSYWFHSSANILDITTTCQNFFA